MLTEAPHFVRVGKLTSASSTADAARTVVPVLGLLSTGASYPMRSCRHYVTWSHVILLLVALRRHDSHVVRATRSGRLVRQVVAASRINERDARATRQRDNNQVGLRRTCRPNPFVSRYA